MRRLLQSSLLTLASLWWVNGLQAQQSYNQTDSFLKSNSVWNIYPNVKYNFNTGTSANATALSGDEGYASVADPNTGALLFYSDGGKCFNVNGAVMANGNGLLGNATSGYTTAQGVCIVPVPGQNKKYYLFSLESGLDAVTPVKLYYSIVDMSLNNGLGDVVTGSKNILLENNTVLSEAMVAIPGNNCDIWLMLHKASAPTFKAYHITTAGINPTPVQSTAGTQIQGVVTASIVGDVPAYAQATMTISPNRQKLAVSCMHIASLGAFAITATTGNRQWGGLLCDFNANTGMVTGGILTDTVPQYSAAFSPDNTKLYYTSVYNSGATVPSRVSQVTISSNDSATIAASRVIVKAAIPSNGTLVGMRAYRDSIYILNPTLLSLDRINKPNLSGAACNYQSTAISFGVASWTLGSSLPQEVVYAPRPDTLRSRILDTVVCNWKAGLKLRPADQTIEDNYVWDNGSNDSTRTITVAGTYWVKYGNSCHYRVDTLVVSGTDLNPVIVANGLQLGTTLPYSTYQWLFNGNIIPGAVNSTYTVSDTGAYSVVVGDGTCTDTATNHHVSSVTAIDDLQYLAAQISMYPNPAKDMVYVNAPIPVDIQIAGIEGRIIRSVKNSHQLAVGDLAAGVYLLRISDKQGRMLKVEKLILEKQ